MEKVRKFRGEIPYFIKEKKKGALLYVCSSYRNLEDYGAVLEDLYPGEVYRLEKKEVEEEQVQRYELYDFFRKKTEGILLLTLDMFVSQYQARGESQRLALGESISLSQLFELLEQHSYQKSYLVEKRGEYSQRGDIVDIYPFMGEEAIRLELFGEEIERISFFAVDSQRSYRQVDSYELYVDNNETRTSFLDFLDLPEKPQLYYENLDLLQYRLEENILLQESREEEARMRSSFAELLELGEEIELTQFSEEDLDCFQSKESLEGRTRGKTLIFRGMDLQYYEHKYPGLHFQYEPYPLFEGYENENSLVLSDRELKGQRIRREKKTKKRLLFSSPEQIQEGEYVIHENYGVGLYLGMELLDGKDYLKIKYADEDRLFIPIESINRIEKYVHVPGVVPEIYHLGRRGFSRKKKKLEEEILAFAKEILEIQAKRQLLQGFVYSPDTVWQEEFEEQFPFTETEAQRKAIQDVKQDMESGKIMDRLICGDVGYGKTEIAIRASFKAIMDQKQVLVLAPTTVLAEQHYHNFMERFRSFPIRIASLSRMRNKKEQEEIVEELKQGRIDLVIGTHRLLSDDISVKNLGLLIIDEEQKFGVKAKEKFKELRGDVNILAMTATPIPRTLNLSLLGIRDLSLVDTAPEGRKPIKTFFIAKDKKEIRKAILKELSREGQVFYIFNSVSRIQDKVKELRELLPDYVKVDYVHGKMSGRELKDKISRFESLQTDVLVATTILENGIDIENANTILIEGMERLGLSQIYQLRGRVGRSSRQSYCYCILADYKSKKAEKREASLIELGEGTGFDLSLEDLKIRGAGEILGEKQHGAIETLGYHFYMKMLDAELKKLRQDPQALEAETLVEEVQIQTSMEKYIPDFYMEKAQKIESYRRALDLKSLEEIEDFALELQDRFGSFPTEVEGFLESLKIQYFAKEIGLASIRESQGGYYLRFHENRLSEEMFQRILDWIQAKKLQYFPRQKELFWEGKLLAFFEMYFTKEEKNC